jgi:hypothetical protein
MVGALSILMGELPNLGMISGLMLIGIGVGMVIARYGNMGPFGGEFGSPWFESELGETLRKEVARAARFDRDLSVVVLRQHSGTPVQWQEHVRQADDVIACRNGWYVLILPETDKDGAHAFLERTMVDLNIEIQAGIMDPSLSHNDPKELGDNLLDLVRNLPEASGAMQPAAIRRDTDRLRWPVG